MKERTAIAIEKFSAATAKALRALGLNALQFPIEMKDMFETEEELVDALANEDLTT